MSDNDKEEGSATRGADWEVVTLTASAYAAAPGPALAQDTTAQASSNALLMSDHFVFPPSEHENLPIETALQEDDDSAEEESTSVEDAGFSTALVGAGSQTVQYYDDGRNLPAHEAEMLGDVPHGFVLHDDDDSQDKSDVPSDSKSPGAAAGSGSPCQYWLKKHMSCLYDQAKDTNALWSVVVAAAFVGLVILWRKDKLHVSCLKWRSSSAVR